ncbi:tetratricopeptide repeat protein [Nocardiopsis alba]|uniref:tetratricopeptide repeat protein n=1 Tax=Nocardiopsis alba TaxID=53437 RepID=UPI00366BDB84
MNHPSPTPQPPSEGADNTLIGNPSGTTVQAHTVQGGVGNTTIVHEGPAAPMALHAVPSPPDGFTGRGPQLHELLARLDPTTGKQGSGTVVVSALSGMGGIGKTALALKAAQVAMRQGWFHAYLFVDLHGYTPHTPPAQAATALEALLRQAGMDPDNIPSKLDERAGFYRAALQHISRSDEHHRPVLVVADNAHTLDQVEPLIPGPGGHRLLVTSRARLTVDGHQPLALDTLPSEEAIELITTRLSDTDSRRSDTEGLAVLARRCGYLPLALKIAAALLARTPHLAPGRLARRLAAPERFTDGRDDLTAVFTASLEHLDADRVRVFALLGSSPGPDISTAAVSSVTDLSPEKVEVVLEELATAHLLTAHPNDRWSMHDLLADHARRLPLPDTEQGDQYEAREQALERLLDFYTVIADIADDHLRALPGDTPPKLFNGRQEALTWLEAEHDNLIAAVQAAHQHGHPRIAIELPAALYRYLGRQRRFDEAIVVHTLARDTARQQGDVPGEAMAWNNLGLALTEVRRFDEAIDTLIHARDLHQQIEDSPGEAMAWNNLGLALGKARRFDEAIDTLIHARDLHQRIEDSPGEAMAWNNLGLALSEVRRFDEAIDAHTRARDLHQQIGNLPGEAKAWNNLGIALRQVRRFDEAINAHQYDLAYCQQAGNTHGEAKAWNNLGLALSEVRRFDEAIDAHTRARDLHQQAGDTQSEAGAWNNLGLALSEVQRFGQAIDALTHARDLHQQVGDTQSEADTWNNLGIALRQVRRFDEAINAHQYDLAYCQQAGNTHGEAMAWNNLGAALVEAQRFDEAIDALTHARDLHQQAGDTHGEAEVWNNLGVTLSRAQRTEEARHAWERASQGFRQVGDLHSFIAVEQLLARTRQRPWWRFWRR